jgi:uncharacterized protein (UPF0305 family)
VTGIATEEMIMKARRLLTGSPIYDIEGVRSSGSTADSRHNEKYNKQIINTYLEMFHSQIYQMQVVEGSFPIQGDD